VSEVAGSDMAGDALFERGGATIAGPAARKSKFNGVPVREPNGGAGTVAGLRVLADVGGGSAGIEGDIETGHLLGF
jgi:hypothetical protein